ncbi:hypothetical protein [Actinokineospora globicatena]|uniref:hypothetical protein n=1 Tax=Actinokineospora globicatena TaxID=103729 RepID=UPI0020A51A61|nr:hypothetical protein [Actinokineospora globicatena]MCP2306090.1 hypothetical protein [Actinokineospora globicatena]GLW80036.1 hypothetical protein Aglo01_45170 [Actinokineospora globicatena]GLW86865.1 hypothetical protein Aglo02_45040 [Actinokineospora globicatena]
MSPRPVPSLDPADLGPRSLVLRLLTGARTGRLGRVVNSAVDVDDTCSSPLWSDEQEVFARLDAAGCFTPDGFFSTWWGREDHNVHLPALTATGAALLDRLHHKGTREDT